MKKCNKLKKLISITSVAAILASNGISLTAVASLSSESSKNSVVENLETLANQKVSDQENPLIISKTVPEIDVYMNTPNDAIKVIRTLPELNDGLVAMLDVDTEVYEKISKNLDMFENKNNIISNGKLSLTTTKNMLLNKIIMAEDDIFLNAGAITSSNLTILYSRGGNIHIDSNELNFNGLIYAPNGKVSITGDSGRVQGMVLGSELDIQEQDFEIMYDEDVNTRYNLLTAIKLDLIEDIGEKYGKYYSESINYEELAKRVVTSNCEEEYYNDIVLERKIPLYDANDMLTAYGYNFSISNKKSGYVILGSHSKTPLIEMFSDVGKLDNDAKKIYYFSSGEIYIQSENGYLTMENTAISLDEFEEYKLYKTACYLNVSREILDSISEANNGIISFLQTENEIFEDKIYMGKTHYGGTDAKAYGYGGIIDRTQYLKSRYGGTPTIIESGKGIKVGARTMRQVSGKDANNCSLVAISKVVRYWGAYRNKTKIPTNIRTIYNNVERIAKKYGYDKDKGTMPTKINNITKDTLLSYGYNVTACNGVYIWSFNGQVKTEINAGRPVILNILRGYYGNHSVTVAGYRVYKTNGKKYPFIKVADGWESGYRFVDYNAFAYDLLTSGFGSFNTASVY